MLLTGTMLRKKTRPVLGVERYDDAALRLWVHCCVLASHQHVDGSATAVDDPRVLFVEGDPEVPDATATRDAAVAKI
jgi:hypothetical protein